MSPRLTSRLMAPVAILSLLLLFMAFGSAWYVRNLQKSVSDAMMNNVYSVRAAQELEISIREVRTQFDRYLITFDDQHLKSMPRLKKRTADALADAEGAATMPQEQLLMKRAREGYEHFFQEYERIMQNRDQWKYPKIIELSDAVLRNEILDPAHEYSKLNEDMLALASIENQKLTDRITMGMVVLGLCGSLAGLLGGAIIAVAIRRSIQKTEDMMRSTAEQLDLAAHHGRPGNENDGTPKDALAQMSRSASAVMNRLRQSERDALRAEQLAWVGQMAAGIAHEIRNPLMSIKLLVQATAERRTGGFKAQDLEVLEEEIVRLEQIVSGFLDFARPPRSILQPVDLRDVIQRTVDGVRARAELQSVNIQFESSPGPTVVSADANQIRQVIFNLLFNALDAQPKGGGISIRVGLDSLPTANPAVLVSVQDDGPGISTELGQSIFEPFVSTKETGMGLGLSICRRIVESHDGELDYITGSGGTTFTMRLPMIPKPSPYLAKGAPPA